MTRRFIIALSLLAVAAASTTAADAATKAKPRPTAIPYYGGIYLSKGLLPGHRYRLMVTSKRRVSFSGNGIENYTWVKNHQFGASSTSLRFKGTTPKGFILSQPVSIKLNAWIIALTLANNRNQLMKVRFIDLGAK